MVDHVEVKMPQSAAWLDPFPVEYGQFLNGKCGDEGEALSAAILRTAVQKFATEVAG